MGEVVAVETQPDGARLHLRVPREFSDLAPGQSLAVNGVCLTVVALEDGVALFDLAAAGRFGGHFVQGHVDGVGTVTRVTPEGDGVWMEVNLPPGLSRYVAEKGSVALDGVSLTVAAVQDSRCAVALIPHTLAVTTLGRRDPGDPASSRPAC